MDLGTTIDPKSLQLNADDLITGPRTIKITRVTGGETKDQPVAIGFEGDNGKPYLPCKSIRRVLVILWGRNGADYVGRSMTLYRDPDVKFGGINVGGIRVSHMSNLDKEVTLVLTASKTSRKPYVVKPLKVTAEAALPAISDELKEAGQDAAMGGVETYTTWLATLEPDVKASVKPYHSAWSKTAKQADETANAESAAEREAIEA